MQYVERHVITRTHPVFREIDRASFASKGLYNKTLYITREMFETTGKVCGYNKLDKIMQTHDVYHSLPAKVAQKVVKQVSEAWKAFFVAIREYKKCPEKFRGKPEPPKYKRKNGRNLVQYTNQAIHKGTSSRKQIIHPADLQPITTTKQNPDKIQQVRIVPRSSHYIVEVVYEVNDPPAENAELDYSLYAAVDIGIDNLATIVFNRPGMTPFAISGRELKSINQFYNKRKAYFKSMLPAGRHTSRRIEAMGDKRYWRVQDYFHKATRFIVDELVRLKVGNLVIGKNREWKQEVNIGRKNNQNFCSIPHDRFIWMLTYKAEAVGIKVTCQEEAYTSKTSFLDNEPICAHEKYLGRRIKRGLFRSDTGTLINADCNGAYNVLRKFAPEAIRVPIASVSYVLHPVRITFNQLNMKKVDPNPSRDDVRE